MNRKTLISLTVFICFLLLLPAQAYSSSKNLSEIVSPERKQELSSYPVEIIIRFNNKARPETFTAKLNKNNITRKFEDIENGKRALVGPEDGLIISTKETVKKNKLKTKIRGPKNKKDVNIRKFFVIVDAMETIGPEGGVIEITDPESPIYGVSIEAPAGAFSSEVLLTMAGKQLEYELPEETTIAGPVIDFGPNGAVFEDEIIITMPYNDADNNGILDGTDIPENYICALTYDNSMARWLYLKKISQDSANNTVVFTANHFTDITVAGLNPSLFGSSDAAFFTIDGLDFSKIIGWGSIGFQEKYRPAYLKTALINGMDLGLMDTDVYSYGGGLSESWSGDANYTEYEMPKLAEILKSEFNKAKSVDKKFIIVTHSWGTVLGYLALSYNWDVVPDLFITLSNPFGSSNIQEGPGGLVKSYILEQLRGTYDYMAEIGRPVTVVPQYGEWINYWTMGDVFSGPIDPINALDPIITYVFGNFTDKIVNQKTLRTIETTFIYHAITSLDARGVDYLIEQDGSWKTYLTNPDDLVLAREFRDRVRCDILFALGDSDCDGIYNDGDKSGVEGDSPCTGGAIENCDDNCPDTPNPDQADSDNDGIGNACDGTEQIISINFDELAEGRNYADTYSDLGITINYIPNRPNNFFLIEYLGFNPSDWFAGCSPPNVLTGRIYVPGSGGGMPYNYTIEFNFSQNVSYVSILSLARRGYAWLPDDKVRMTAYNEAGDILDEDSTDITARIEIFTSTPNITRVIIDVRGWIAATFDNLEFSSSPFFE